MTEQAEDDHKDKTPEKKRKRKKSWEKDEPEPYSVEADYNFIPKKLRLMMEFMKAEEEKDEAKKILKQHHKEAKRQQKALKAAKTGKLGAEAVGPEAGERVVMKKPKIELLKPWAPLVQKIEAGDVKVEAPGLEKPKLIIQRKMKKSSGKGIDYDSDEEPEEIVGFADEVALEPPKLTFTPKYSDESLFPDKLVWKEAVKMQAQSSKPLDKSRESFEQMRLDAVERYRRYKDRVTEVHTKGNIEGHIIGKRRRL